MKKVKWPKIILIASLCFNFFFMASFMIMRLKLEELKTAKGRMTLASKVLDLDESQTKKLFEYNNQIRQVRADTKKDHADAIEEFWQELSKTEPNYDMIRKSIDMAVGERHKIRLVAAEKLQDFFKILTPPQRRLAANKLRMLIELKEGK
jgi:Spy/CpxP family protein refolding chaperone